MKNAARILMLSAIAGIFAAMLAGCASPDERRTAGEYLDDQTINARVKTSLLSDDIIRGRSISTTTYEGVVQLSGFVDNASEMRRAEQLASEVDGVRDVINNIEIKPDDVQYGEPGERTPEEDTNLDEPDLDEPDLDDRIPPLAPENPNSRSVPPPADPID